MTKLSTQPYKGARDFYPEDKRLQNYMFSVWKKVAERFGYEEYSAPVLEPLEIYTSKTSDEIVSEQTYSFTDRGGRNVVLRPEMTPSVSRMVAGRRQELAYPIRWYSMPDCWRYERPQRGRNRQFWQFNADIFGVDTVDADLEIISMADAMMKEFGGTDDMYQIQINSRKLINLIMSQYLELDAAQARQMISLFDKKNKMDSDMFMKQSLAIFNESQKESSKLKMTALLETKSLADLPDELRSSQAVREVQVLFTLLGEHGVTSTTFDISLMRGFDYYTDIVFEVSDTAPENNRALFGGGRYDGLVASFGVEPIGTVGFGMGDATIENFLEVHKLLPILAPATQVYVVTIGQVLKDAQTVVAELRAGGLNVAVDITPRKPEKQVKAALKLGVPYLLFIGEEEIKNKTFILRKVENQEEETLTAAAIIEKLSS
jgi:histidyl-tRNA synthetase